MHHNVSVRISELRQTSSRGRRTKTLFFSFVPVHSAHRQKLTLVHCSFAKFSTAKKKTADDDDDDDDGNVGTT